MARYRVKNHKSIRSDSTNESGIFKRRYDISRKVISSRYKRAGMVVLELIAKTAHKTTTYLNSLIGVNPNDKDFPKK